MLRRIDYPMACYFLLAGAVIVWMIWHDTHLPNCSAMYGVGAPHDSVELWLDCSRSNTSEVFLAQLIGILLIVAAMIVGPLIGLLLEATVKHTEPFRYKNNPRYKFFGRVED